MVERILVATDGSPAASRGVSWAASLAGAVGAELIVTAVVDTRSFTGDIGAERSRVAVELDDEWAEPAAGISRVTTLVLEGDPRVVLPEATVSQGADLLVLGSAGTGWYPALHLGHVAHAVAHHSPVPVVIVPPGTTPVPPRRLLVGVDGSAGSGRAVAWTAAAARRLEAEVVAVSVQLGASAASDLDMEASVKEWTAPLQTAGVPTRIVTGEGWPATVLADLEVSEAPGLVVLGARGSGGYRGLQLGSVALGVLQRTIVPVAVIPVGDAATGA